MTQHFLHRRNVSSRRAGEGGCCMAAAVIGEVLFYPCLVLDAPDILGSVVRFLDEVVHEGIGCAFVTWRQLRLGKAVEGGMETTRLVLRCVMQMVGVPSMSLMSLHRRCCMSPSRKPVIDDKPRAMAF